MDIEFYIYAFIVGFILTGLFNLFRWWCGLPEYIRRKNKLK